MPQYTVQDLIANYVWISNCNQGSCNNAFLRLAEILPEICSHPLHTSGYTKKLQLQCGLHIDKDHISFHNVDNHCLIRFKKTGSDDQLSILASVGKRSHQLQMSTCLPTRSAYLMKRKPRTDHDLGIELQQPDSQKRGFNRLDMLRSAYEISVVNVVLMLLSTRVPYSN